MKTNDKNNKLIFSKSKWIIPYFVLLCFVIASLLIVCKSSLNYNKQISENNTQNENTPLFSIDKIVCYSSAYGVSNIENQAKWNLNLSQYTDIAIYLNLHASISSMYIDDVSFSNVNTGKLSLSYLDAENFGKSYLQSIETSAKDTANNENSLENLQDTNKIFINSFAPITLRYLNENLKENCTISDIKETLTFDGSLLKRGKVALSPLKNNISFNLHAVSTNGEEFSSFLNVPINLENKETDKSIYNGSYLEEILNP